MSEGGFEARKWSYRQTKDGIVVSFQVHPNDMPAALAIAPLGTIYMIGFAEVDPNTGDVAQRTEQRNSTPQAEGSSPSAPAKPNSTRAVMMAKDVEFWNYLGSIAGIKHPASADEAEGAIKFLCGITSKKELNDRPKAAEAFERLRQDFYTYRNALKMGAA